MQFRTTLSVYPLIPYKILIFFFTAPLFCISYDYCDHGNYVSILWCYYQANLKDFNIIITSQTSRRHAEKVNTETKTPKHQNTKEQQRQQQA